MATHLEIGKQQQLFFFDDTSSGCCYFLPHGTIIYNTLQEWMRKEYKKRGFQEVKTPIMAKQSLWEQSGHWQKYKSNMFTFKRHEEDDYEMGLAAMGCPKACVIFNHQPRSYRDLPLRLADAGVLCRNELSGAVTSLTRNYTFCQDDAHVVCMFNQVEQEMSNAIDFLTAIYKRFDFQFIVGLSTRPDESMGTDEQWRQAENILHMVLKNKQMDYHINDKDGAFYGPKIDIQLMDSQQRYHQCATIQLDFQLPHNFNLQYVDNNNNHQQPVMIHRAIYGSYERFIAILCEHYQGKWPFWLSPFQVKLLLIDANGIDYMLSIKNKLIDLGYHVHVDMDDTTINKKIKKAQEEQYNYIVVIGKNEVKNNTIAVRYRDHKEHKTMTLDQLINELVML